MNELNISIVETEAFTLTKIYNKDFLVIANKFSDLSNEYFVPTHGVFQRKFGVQTSLNGHSIKSKRFRRVESVFKRLKNLAKQNKCLCKKCLVGEIKPVNKDYRFSKKPNHIHVIPNLFMYECDVCGYSRIPAKSCKKLSNI